MKNDQNTSITDLINKLSISSKNSFNKMIKRYGVSADQWAVISNVVRDAGLTQKQLSQMINKDQGNLTRMIDKLVNRGYILRDIDENDRRSVKLLPTHSSKQLVEKISPIEQEHYENLLKSFNQEDKERLLELLNKAYLNISSL
jgi:DNA-binding MarR family transcriptional regulator